MSAARENPPAPWELVIRVYESSRPGASSWIMPFSEGRHFRRTLIGAWRSARRWNRNRALATATFPMAWEVRPAKPTSRERTDRG